MKKSKPYKKVIINGEFFCNDLSGIERFAYEVTCRLDCISKKNEIGIIVTKDAKNVPQFQHLSVIEYPENIGSRPIWQQIRLPRIAARQRALCLDFGNAGSFWYPGITFLHDIYCEDHKEDFISKREKHERLYFRILYRIIAYRAKKIITVSEFSRNQIAKAFHIKAEKIAVIHSCWNHFDSVTPDYRIFDAHPALQKPFYFSLGSLSKRKNIKWIVEYAARHSDETFVLSGQSLLTVKVPELENLSLPNIILLGRLNDAQVKALMERCKAFILPSYYEGFGLTPLEALSSGASIIVAHAASLPEIYGAAAHYIDPYDIDVDLDALLTQPVDDPAPLLKKYSYDKSVSQIYEIIQEFTGGAKNSY